VDLAKQQRPLIGEYWSDYAKSQASFENADSVIGTTWQIIANYIKLDNKPVKAIKPSEGSTGWSDTWMISSTAQHPNCAYLYMNYELSPEVQAQVAEWFGEAPANVKACDLTVDPNHCKVFHAEQDSYWDNVFYWKTPEATCPDGRGDVCTPFDAWKDAWTEIKG
jgi:putative spermidine/putrescine transport system substrate-binding protein